VHGHPLNEPDQPVVRVTWEQARAFCVWLSEKTAKTFRLPTEAEWEYAARAGTSSPMFSDDLARVGNMADTQLSRMARDWYIIDLPIPNPTKYDDWIPKGADLDDGAFLSVAPGRYQPNAWGLNDMHGNVAEWTNSNFTPYPYRPWDGREDLSASGRKVVRGGSWRDRPARCTSSFRLGYQPYQPVYNVGFRVVCETRATGRVADR